MLVLVYYVNSDPFGLHLSGVLCCKRCFAAIISLCVSVVASEYMQSACFWSGSVSNPSQVDCY